MTAPQREGLHRGRITDYALGYTRTNPQKPQFTCKIYIEEWYSAADQRWYTVEAECSEIAAFLCLQMQDRKTGQLIPNDISINQLKDALGWDGLSVTTLDGPNAPDFTFHKIQVYVKNEEWPAGSGKYDMKAKSIGAYDAPVGLRKASPEQLRQMSQSLDMSLRASAPQPAPGAPRPAPGAQPAPPRRQAASPSPSPSAPAADPAAGATPPAAAAPAAAPPPRRPPPPRAGAPAAAPAPPPPQHDPNDPPPAQEDDLPFEPAQE